MVELTFSTKAVLLFLAGGVAGIVNSVAGGGTLISFPALVLCGVPVITANATNTVALLPGGVSSLCAYRGYFSGQKEWALRLAGPSLAGGLVGAVLLLKTGEARFEAIVPYLILFAAVLFTLQGRVARRLRLGAEKVEHSTRSVAWAIAFQFCISVYGGYFGAGIGILMLATLALLGQKNIHQMNSLKALLATLCNGISAIYFVAAGSVSWPYALLVLVGGTAGGYAGARLALYVGEAPVRTFVSVFGFVLGFYFLLR